MTSLFIADSLWAHLDQVNQSFAQALLRLSELYARDPKNYKTAIKYIASLQPAQVCNDVIFKSRGTP